MNNKLFIDTRTGEIKTRFSVLEARFMRELTSQDVVNNTKQEMKKSKKKEKVFRRLRGFE